MVNALNHLRNSLLKGNRDTEPVDNILLKVIQAKGVRKRDQNTR